MITPSAGGKQKTTMVEITTMLPDGSKINAGQVLTSTVIEMRTVALDGKTCIGEIPTQLPPRNVLFKKSESPYIVVK